MGKKYGFLYLLNLIGGNIVSLLIGNDAWRDSSSLLYVRPIIGGFFFGSIVGAICAYFWSVYLILAGAVVFALIGYLLEEFRREMLN